MPNSSSDDQAPPSAATFDLGLQSEGKEFGEVELFLLRELVAAFEASSAGILEQARATGSGVDASLARMQHPTFKRLAQLLSVSIPKDATFGRFGQRKGISQKDPSR